MWVARWGRRAIRERCALSLSQEDCSALAQVSNNSGVRRADPPLVNRRTVFSRQTFGLHDVFCPKRDIGELAVPDWMLRLHLNPSVDGGIHRANTIETELQRSLARFTGGTQPLSQCHKLGCL